MYIKFRERSSKSNSEIWEGNNWSFASSAPLPLQLQLIKATILRRGDALGCRKTSPTPADKLIFFTRENKYFSRLRQRRRYFYEINKMLPILLLLYPTYLSNLPCLEASYLANPRLPSSSILNPQSSIQSNPSISPTESPSSPLLCSSEGLCCPHRSSKCVVKQALSIFPNPSNLSQLGH